MTVHYRPASSAPWLANVLAVLSALLLVRTAWSAEPLVLFNHDAGAGALTQFEPPITTEQLCRQLDELRGTSVGVFLFCVNIGGDMFLCSTKVGEVCGAAVTDWNTVHEKYRAEMRRATGNLRQLEAAGKDPIAIVRDRCRRQNMQFWLTLRMNEIHEDDERWNGLRSQFKLANRRLLLEKDFPLPAVGYAEKFGYSYAWDYGKSEVREHLVALLTEMLDRYKPDGLELDFMRHAMFFRGQEAAGIRLMTDLVRKVRAEVDRVAKVSGQPVALAVRVYPDLARNERCGLDPKTWIRQGLVDVVTPMDDGYLDMQPNLREFVDVAKGTKVKIAGGLEQATKDYGHLSKAMAFAAAGDFLQQGAGAIYFFNYDCHRLKGRTNPYTAEEREILAKIGHPDQYARADKYYFVTRDMEDRTAAHGGVMQLPASIRPGKPIEFQFTIGDDLELARRDGVLESVRLSVTVSGYEPRTGAVEVECNGTRLGSERWQGGGKTFTCQNPPLVRGENRLLMRLKDHGGNSPGAIRLERIETWVHYR